MAKKADLSPSGQQARVTAAFRPSLMEAVRGYDTRRFTQDLIAGATVGVVALPLAMAFAMASGLKPEAGIVTAVIAGFLISALGGSRVQIGGPAGAFIVIVYGIVDRYGVANLVIATALSGVMLFLMGLFRLGTLIRFIPIAVVIGFTNGIAVLIALSQVKDFLGLRIVSMPASFFGMLSALSLNIGTIHSQSVALSCVALALVVVWQLVSARLGRHSKVNGLSAVPGSVVALVTTTAAVWLLDLQVDTIGSRFGGIPSTLPSPSWPGFSWESARFMLVPASTLAMLGAIESLLCARVADSLTGGRHDPNQELMAQGVANVVTPFFGGMPATGTIARTMTNIKSGATSPIAGIAHALTLLLIMWVAAPLATHVPLASLAAILMFVAWNMGEWREFAHLRQYRLPYRVTLLAVFLLTVVFDLTVAVEVGLVAACITFIYRISSLTRSTLVTVTEAPELSGYAGQIVARRLHGALFFGAVKLIEEIQDQLPSRAVVLDFANLMYVDSSGIDALVDLVKSCERHGLTLVFSNLAHQPLDIARRSGLLTRLGPQGLQPDLQQALKVAMSVTGSISATA